jgi:hypothetical protein
MVERENGHKDDESAVSALRQIRALDLLPVHLIDAVRPGEVRAVSGMEG